MRGSASPSPARAHPRCPTCYHPVIWEGNPHRPFCSLACRLVDLGVWLDEGYRIPGPEVASPEDPTGKQD